MTSKNSDAYDQVQPVPGGVNLAGWAIDPDTDAPIQVHFYAGDGVPRPGVNPGLPLTANTSRPDVAQHFPGYGANHGFSGFVKLPAGNHRVCAYGINTPAGGENPQLGCQPVTVTPPPFAPADRPVALKIADTCKRSGPCQFTWQQPDLHGGDLAYYEIEAARNGRELPTLRVPSTSAQYSGTAFGTCGPTVIQVRAVTKRPSTGELVPGAEAMTNTVETGCNAPRAAIAAAKLSEQGDHEAIVVTIQEPTNGAGTCLIRVNTAAKWTGACGHNQPTSQAQTRTVAIPVTDRAPSYAITVTASNAEGSETSATTTLKSAPSTTKPPTPLNTSPNAAPAASEATSNTGAASHAETSTKQVQTGVTNPNQNTETN